MNTKTFILATVALLTLGMAGCNNSDSKQNPEAAAPVIAEGGLKIAYVDTDTIMAKYQYAIDLNEELLAYTDRLQQLSADRRQPHPHAAAGQGGRAEAAHGEDEHP